MVPTLAMVGREAGRKEENVKFPLDVTWPKLQNFRLRNRKVSSLAGTTRRAKSSRSLKNKHGQQTHLRVEQK